MSNLSYKSRLSLAAITIMLVVCMFLGSSYALWKIEKVQENPNVINTGCIDIEFIENTSGNINLTNAYPISDEKGLADTYPNKYNFTIHNSCTIDVDYHLYLNSLKVAVAGTVKGKIDDSLIKYALYEQGKNGITAQSFTEDKKNKETESFTKKSQISASYKIAEGTLAKDAEIKYTLRLWISDTATKTINNYGFEANLATIAYARNK